MDLGQMIRNARQTRGWTQNELAKRVGTSGSSVKNWEAGRNVPRDSIPRLEEVLGLDLSAVTPTRERRILPRLDEASDAQLLGELTDRLADRSEENRDLIADLAEAKQEAREQATRILDLEDRVRELETTRVLAPQPHPDRHEGWAARARDKTPGNQ